MRAMAFTKRIVTEIPTMPLWSKVGFIVIVLGLGADVIAHLGPGVEHDHGGATASELSAHLVVFIGMVVVLVGVVVDGVQRRQMVEPIANSKETI